MFVGYPEGTRGYSFYSLEDKRVFVTTNARFLEVDYINNFKQKSKVVLEDMLDARNNTSSKATEDKVVVSNTLQLTTVEIPSTIMPRRSKRIV
jgi:hypothetical protein